MLQPRDHGLRGLLRPRAVGPEKAEPRWLAFRACSGLVRAYSNGDPADAAAGAGGARRWLGLLRGRRMRSYGDAVLPRSGGGGGLAGTRGREVGGRGLWHAVWGRRVLELERLDTLHLDCVVVLAAAGRLAGRRRRTRAFFLRLKRAPDALV